MLPAVQYGNLRPPGCALVADIAGVESRGDRDVTLRVVTWSPNKLDYDRVRQVQHFMQFRCLG